jgi:DNA-binding NtrC family response regulator
MRTLSPMLAKDFALLRKVATSRVSVLLLGETGTGKEVLARAVHHLAGRSGPLVPVNCGAIPANLVESQLFGHVRGAFSGSVRDEPGFVRAADRGTLFLDEIADLPLAAQPALLRVLQEGEVVPVGSTEARRVDLRVVSATHGALGDLAARGSFREDLLARLAGFTFALPPLRERRGDLGVLVADLLAGDAPVASIDPEAAWALVRHRWPQNVRELARVLSLAAAMGEGGALGVAQLPPDVARAPTPEEGDVEEEEDDASAGDPSPMRAELIAQLERQRGNVTEVARALGKRRAQVYRWLKVLRLDPKLYRE